MPTDPLSDVLSVLVPRTYGAGAFDLAGQWSIYFRKHPGFKCYALEEGECWLQVEGVPEPVLLTSGACFLLSQGRPFRLASDLNLTSVLYSDLPRAGGIATGNGGGECFIVGGHFALADRHASLLFGAIPPVIHICDEAEKEALRWSLERMRHELEEGKAGASLMAQHLSQMILVQALRLVGGRGTATDAGLLFALADRQISAAMSAMHNEPGHRWTLDALAREAAMSRSAFAARFRELVGESPIDYLTRWRMLLAGKRLAAAQEPIAAIARSLGYISESSFSTAFKRVMGCSPRQYGREDPAMPAPRADDETLGTGRVEPIFA